MMSTLTVENNVSDCVELFLLFYRLVGILFGKTVEWRKNVESYSRALLLVENKMKRNEK